jgi:hypothetical protein
MFKDLQVDVITKWRDAHRRLLESNEYQSDKELQVLPTLDILLAFEDYSRVQEREFEEQMRRTTLEKTRKERKAREGFKVILLHIQSSYIQITLWLTWQYNPPRRNSSKSSSTPAPSVPARSGSRSSLS